MEWRIEIISRFMMFITGNTPSYCYSSMMFAGHHQVATKCDHSSKQTVFMIHHPNEKDYSAIP